MRAVVLREFGAPENLVLEDVPDPVPGQGEVLIAVEAIGIPFVETQVRAGRGPSAAHRPALPLILGNAVGGVVIAVGAGVNRMLEGRRVVSATGGKGGYAERVTVNADEPILVPEELPVDDAVALLADGRTAVGLHRIASPEEGEWVLVESAGGGLGSLLVQLAHAAGARVIGAAGNAEKLELAKRLGAEVTVDYTVPEWTSLVSATTGGVDVVFDGVGGAIGEAAIGLVRKGGRFVIHGMASGSATAIPADPPEGVEFRGLGDFPREPEKMRDLTRDALELAAAGRLRPTIGQVFALDRAAEAHVAIESRTVLGKTLLIP